ncbi:Type-4 uracil-DNA glycosylase [Gammaproteobacteria bacterium]
MNNKKQYLKEMEIELWQSKRTTAASCLATSGWSELEKQVATCALCGLHKTRTQVVFGVGNKNAEVMFIGEAPGANEDLQGEPFVGRAGMLLNSMVQSIGLKRSDIYIANILKCRPPNNRDPEPQEVKLCTSYLEQQIALIQPKILVAVGRIAAHFLLNTTESMGHLRGRTYQYGSQNTPLIVTYHPAYLLRSPSEKRKAYVDFLLIKKMIGGIAD